MRSIGGVSVSGATASSSREEVQGLDEDPLLVLVVLQDRAHGRLDQGLVELLGP
jgi:hypothetical protein